MAAMRQNIDLLRRRLAGTCGLPFFNCTLGMELGELHSVYACMSCNTVRSSFRAEHSCCNVLKDTLMFRAFSCMPTAFDQCISIFICKASLGCARGKQGHFRRYFPLIIFLHLAHHREC